MASSSSRFIEHLRPQLLIRNHPLVLFLQDQILLAHLAFEDAQADEELLDVRHIADLRGVNEIRISLEGVANSRNQDGCECIADGNHATSLISRDESTRSSNLKVSSGISQTGAMV
jgi:hypothetical protein